MGWQAGDVREDAFFNSEEDLASEESDEFPDNTGASPPSPPKNFRERKKAAKEDEPDLLSHSSRKREKPPSSAGCGLVARNNSKKAGGISFGFKLSSNSKPAKRKRPISNAQPTVEINKKARGPPEEELEAAKDESLPSETDKQ